MKFREGNKIMCSGWKGWKQKVFFFTFCNLILTTIFYCFPLDRRRKLHHQKNIEISHCQYLHNLHIEMKFHWISLPVRVVVFQLSRLKLEIICSDSLDISNESLMQIFCHFISITNNGGEWRKVQWRRWLDPRRFLSAHHIDIAFQIQLWRE